MPFTKDYPLTADLPSGKGIMDKTDNHTIAHHTQTERNKRTEDGVLHDYQEGLGVCDELQEWLT